jgi:hypothetical protein
VRATTILLPLLGLTYVLMITSPGDDVTSTRIYGYVNAILQSTQGLVVAVCYCFMNGEVRLVYMFSPLSVAFSEVREGRKVRLNAHPRIDGPTWRFEAQRTANGAKGARETRKRETEGRERLRNREMIGELERRL